MTTATDPDFDADPAAEADADPAEAVGIVDPAEARRLRRWRLVLGGAAEHPDCGLDAAGLALDSALDALYGDAERGAGLGGSAPRVARWLGDIRDQFPVPVVRVLQRDAMERLGLKRMLLEPELMQGLEPDVHLAATLVSLAHVMPAKAKETARIVVRRAASQTSDRAELCSILSDNISDPETRRRFVDAFTRSGTHGGVGTGGTGSHAKSAASRSVRAPATSSPRWVPRLAASD